MSAASPIPSLLRRLSRSFVEHWCRIADDYRTVAKETAAACLKKPLKVRKYESQCPNLEDWTVIELFNNVHDVGFLGRWRWLDQKLNDYDVDHEELSKLSD